MSPKFCTLKKLTVFSLIGISGETIEQSDGSTGFALATTEEDVGRLSSSLSTASLEEIEVRVGEKRTIGGKPAHWVLWENSNHRVLKTSRENEGEAFSPVAILE